MKDPSEVYAEERSICMTDSDCLFCHFINATSSLREVAEKETQILESLTHGLSSKHIAETLTISKDTVETHRKNILKKLQADNMVQAVANAFRNKILK